VPRRQPAAAARAPSSGGSSVTLRVLPAAELEGSLLNRWSEIQQLLPSLSSPFFCPDFTTAVARTREDVHVCVFEREGRPVGFFPFQRGRFGVGCPVGSHLSDYHGAIVETGVPWDARSLIAACELSVWAFDHLLASQEPFASAHRLGQPSWVMDLPDGAEAYLQSRRDAGVREIAAAARKRRKLEREHGELRFAHHITDPGALSTLMAWKSEQYRRTGAADYLARGWVRELLRLAHARQTPTFAGVLSGLYAEDRLLAAHFGIRSASVLHYWYPAYDPAFGQYSPGLILLLEMAGVAASEGIRAIDLGKGEARYKRALASSTVPLAEGAVVRASPAAGAWRLRREARALLKRSAIGPRLRRLAAGLPSRRSSAAQAKSAGL